MKKGFPPFPLVVAENVGQYFCWKDPPGGEKDINPAQGIPEQQSQQEEPI